MKGIVLAGGSGTRMNNSKPKQFLLVNDKPLFLYSVEAFQNNKRVDMVLIVTNKECVEQVKELTKNYSKVKSVIAGGETRQGSVYNGLKEIEKYITSEKDLVLIPSFIHSSMGIRSSKKIAVRTEGSTGLSEVLIDSHIFVTA